MYLRDTRAALRDAAREAEEILDSVADGLATGEWDGHRAGEWHERALRLGRLVDQARSAIGWSRESMRVNPGAAAGTPSPRPARGTPTRWPCSTMSPSTPRA